MMDFGVNRIQERLVTMPGEALAPGGQAQVQATRPVPPRPEQGGSSPRAAAGLDDLKKLVDEANKTSEAAGQRYRFDIRVDGGEMIVQVTDPYTDEVVREIPPKELVELRQRLEKTLGIIFDSSG